ncbi:LPXTG cell wall anchor domain-containing protein [Streptomyces sp. TRM68367]|uniref:LPXTG cell wall anchor domain-containing protein n=1 Tax=Streptomyces sp. TRM68367 TaxID=2758415 RepID=UPI00165BB255|nr:LPXTG cell wall anchor domain-containing protein [Streptomyces sp. TRM68367]MBC9728406.1 LPXTG cell wall anchor domain-containing protein [Streptomyces sp. TRM68367]
MSSVRRPLLTATAAGTLLGALWFVPSANATADASARVAHSTTSTTQAKAVPADASETEAQARQARLAATGSFDTTPYVVGGTVSLTLGAGFVVYSMRRERLGL